MRISLQVALGYFLIVGLAAYFLLNVFVVEVRPGVRQAMEDTLVDTVNLLAELAAPDLKAGHIGSGAFAEAVRAYSRRPIDADIWAIRKRSLDYRVYVTDARGMVVFATNPAEVGKDYSNWRDVYLTLRGAYGARSTRDDPADQDSSVMHVAAPVLDGGHIIGVVTVGKPNLTVQPFVERSEDKIRTRGALLLVTAALIGVLFSWHLTRSIGRLRDYARAVAAGRKLPPPGTGARELAELGRALEAMRAELEGKQYVEQYVHALTHELKSPLAAIRGAAELLREPTMPAAERARFLGNIGEQAERLRQVADKMLHLARLEQRQALSDPVVLELAALAEETVESLTPTLQARALDCTLVHDEATTVRGERFLLQQALRNLLENAIAFSPASGQVQVAVRRHGAQVEVEVCDQGPGVPDYAAGRVFERFFSLPRPDTGKKSTGLGLTFVREVAALHGGTVSLDNRPEGGARARLTLPAQA